ncbi:hypothetical protein [Streptococcus salivarius]
MTKKLLFAVLMVVSLFLCSSAVNKAITYDNDFIISLAKGLDKRWEDASSNYEDTTAYYEKATQFELSEVGRYKERTFKDDKLKKLAIEYINVLEDSKELTSKENDHFSSDSWVEYRRKRFELILDINSRKKIPVQDTRHLRDIVNIGIKVKQTNEIIQALKKIFKGNNFTISKSSENSDELNCSGTFENTTGYYLSYVPMTIAACDKNGEVFYSKVDAAITKWSEGTTKELNFTVYDPDHEFNEVKVFLDEKGLEFR